MFFIFSSSVINFLILFVKLFFKKNLKLSLIFVKGKVNSLLFFFLNHLTADDGYIARLIS